MVTARRPRTQPSRRETPAEKFERVRAEPIGTPLKLTKREARYFLKRLAGSDPDAPSGEQVMRQFYGDWSEDDESSG